MLIRRYAGVGVFVYGIVCTNSYTINNQHPTISTACNTYIHISATRSDAFADRLLFCICTGNNVSIYFVRSHKFSRKFSPCPSIPQHQILKELDEKEKKSLHRLEGCTWHPEYGMGLIDFRHSSLVVRFSHL